MGATANSSSRSPFFSGLTIHVRGLDSDPSSWSRSCWFSRSRHAAPISWKKDALPLNTSPSPLKFESPDGNRPLSIPLDGICLDPVLSCCGAGGAADNCRIPFTPPPPAPELSPPGSTPGRCGFCTATVGAQEAARPGRGVATGWSNPLPRLDASLGAPLTSRLGGGVMRGTKAAALKASPLLLPAGKFSGAELCSQSSSPSPSTGARQCRSSFNSLSSLFFRAISSSFSRIAFFRSALENVDSPAVYGMGTRELEVNSERDKEGFRALPVVGDAVSRNGSVRNAGHPQGSCRLWSSLRIPCRRQHSTHVQERERNAAHCDGRSFGARPHSDSACLRPRQSCGRINH